MATFEEPDHNNRPHQKAAFGQNDQPAINLATALAANWRGSLDCRYDPAQGNASTGWEWTAKTPRRPRLRFADQKRVR